MRPRGALHASAEAADARGGAGGVVGLFLGLRVLWKPRQEAPVAPEAANLAAGAVLGLDADGGGAERAERVLDAAEGDAAADEREHEQRVVAAALGPAPLLERALGVALGARADARRGRPLLARREEDGVGGGEVGGVLLHGRRHGARLVEHGGAQGGGGALGAAEVLRAVVGSAGDAAGRVHGHRRAHVVKVLAGLGVVDDRVGDASARDARLEVCALRGQVAEKLVLAAAELVQRERERVGQPIGLAEPSQDGEDLHAGGARAELVQRHLFAHPRGAGPAERHRQGSPKLVVGRAEAVAAIFVLDVAFLFFERELAQLGGQARELPDVLGAEEPARHVAHGEALQAERRGLVELGGELGRRVERVEGVVVHRLEPRHRVAVVERVDPQRQKVRAKGLRKHGARGLHKGDDGGDGRAALAEPAGVVLLPRRGQRLVKRACQRVAELGAGVVEERRHRRGEALDARLDAGRGRAERRRVEHAHRVAAERERARRRRHARHGGDDEAAHSLAGGGGGAGDERRQALARRLQEDALRGGVAPRPRRAERRVHALVEPRAGDGEGAADDGAQAGALGDGLLEERLPAARARVHRLDEQSEQRQRLGDALVLEDDAPREQIRKVVLGKRVEDAEDAGRGRLEEAGLAVFDKGGVRRRPRRDQRGVIVAPRRLELPLAVGRPRPRLAAELRLAERHRLAGLGHGPALRHARPGERGLDRGAEGEAHRGDRHPRLGPDAKGRPVAERGHVVEEPRLQRRVRTPLRRHVRRALGVERGGELGAEPPFGGAARRHRRVQHAALDAAAGHLERDLVKVPRPEGEVHGLDVVAEQRPPAAQRLRQPRVVKRRVPVPQRRVRVQRGGPFSAADSTGGGGAAGG